MIQTRYVKEKRIFEIIFLKENETKIIELPLTMCDVDKNPVGIINDYIKKQLTIEFFDMLIKEL